MNCSDMQALSWHHLITSVEAWKSENKPLQKQPSDCVKLERTKQYQEVFVSRYNFAIAFPRITFPGILYLGILFPRINSG